MVKGIRKSGLGWYIFFATILFLDPAFFYFLVYHQIFAWHSSSFFYCPSTDVSQCFLKKKKKKKPHIQCNICAHERIQVFGVCSRVCTCMSVSSVRCSWLAACMLLYTEALGQTPSALITAAINQTSTDICVIPLQYSFLEGGTSVNWIWLDSGMMLLREHLKVIIRRWINWSVVALILQSGLCCSSQGC